VHKRPPRRGSRREDRVDAQSSGGDGGCLVLVLLLLWYFGYVSFGKQDGKLENRLAEARSEIASAQAQLSQLDSATAELKTEAAQLRTETTELAAERSRLEERVRALQATRDQIADNLRAASEAVAPREKSRFRRVAEVLFSGVPSELIASAITALLAWVTRPIWLRWARKLRRGDRTKTPAA
jgi:cell division protein FtsB